MKTPPARNRRHLILTAVAGIIGTFVLLSGCSRHSDKAPHAAAAIDGGKVVVAGARPAFSADAVPVANGFFEHARWDASIQTLQCKGWAPVDVRGAGVRFVLRDPHDRLLLEGTPLFAAQERTDVAAAHAQRPELLHSGFTASVRLTNLPAAATWTDTLELYCLDGNGGLFRLTRVDAPNRQSWDRRTDRFEVALTYTEPQLAAAEKPQGSLDVCEPGPASGSVRLAGWAPFDGQSPRSVLIVQLAPSVAPASILSCAWIPRPDVRAAVDPARTELDRCGFEIVLQFAGSSDDLRATGALRLWAIDAAQTASSIGLAALRSKP